MTTANIPTEVNTEVATEIFSGRVSSDDDKPDSLDTAASGNDAEKTPPHSEEEQEVHDDLDEDAYDNLREDDRVFAAEYRVSASQIEEEEKKKSVCHLPITAYRMSQWVRAALSPEYAACLDYRRGKLVEITSRPGKPPSDKPRPVQSAQPPPLPSIGSAWPHTSRRWPWSGKQGKSVSRPPAEGSPSAPITPSTYVQPGEPICESWDDEELQGVSITNEEPFQVRDDGYDDGPPVAPNEEFALKWTTIEYELEQYIAAGLIPEDSAASAGLNENSHFHFKLCAEELQNNLYDERLLECLGNLRGFRRLFSKSDDWNLRQVFRGKPTEVLQNLYYGGDGILHESRMKLADPFHFSKVGNSDAYMFDK